jgi:peptidoglycan/LPS O-acetylase OafA/YrhL
VNVRTERFPLMDSLRAIAALAVLGSHAALFAGLYTSDSVLAPYAIQLTTGVSVFFVISGFLLYRPFVRARLAGEPAPDTGAYAWRRFLRIVPAYWVALTAIAIWFSLSAVVHPAWHVPLFYGFGQIYTAETSQAGLGQAWTLCVEVTFYAFLPLWALAVRRLGWRAELAALAALFAFSVGWKLFALDHASPSKLGPFESGPWLHPLPNFLDQFALGMGLAVVSARGLPERAERALRRAWPWWLMAAVAFWAVSTQIGLPSVTISNGTFLLAHELQAAVAVGLLVPAVFGSERGGAIRRVLAWRPLLWVGLVSYGIYLWHLAIVDRLAHRLTGWMTGTLGLGVDGRFALLFVLGAAAATAVAAISYYVVERPALSLKRLVGPAPERTQPAEAIAEPAPAVPGGAR